VTKRIIIDGQEIGEGCSPYVVAEMSANHNGSLDAALKIINEVKSAGANAVKIQTYKPDTITMKSNLPDFQIKSGLWSGRTLWDLYEWAHTPWEWHRAIFAHAQKVGITIFSSPFDCSAVDFLEDLNVPAYKVASFEVIDIPLIRYIASTGKPMIISTGMADALEIEEAIEAAYEGGCKDVAVLHCVSGYPAPAKDYNIFCIPDMIDRFKHVTGLSDHTLGNATAIASVALGASIIEKHVTLDRTAGGPDDSFSLQPHELASLCQDVKTAWESLGHVNYDRKSSETENMKFRRSLYFVKDMSYGEVVTDLCVKSIRPGFGLAPKYINNVIGRQMQCDVAAGTAVKWSHVDVE